MSYREDVMRTFHGSGNLDNDLLMTIAGIIGETGEVVDWAKKNMFHAKKPGSHLLVAELGDVLWYVEAYRSLRGLNPIPDYGYEEIQILTSRQDREKLIMLKALDMQYYANVFNQFATNYLTSGDTLHRPTFHGEVTTGYILNGVSAIAHTLGYDMPYIKEFNTAKLLHRYPVL